MGYTPLLTGLAFLPAAVGGIVGGSIAGVAVKRFGVKWAAVTGIATLALGTALLSRIGPEGSLAWVVVGYGVGPIGLVATGVITTIAATAGVTPDRQGLVAGLLNTSQQVGGGVRIALASVVATATTRSTGVAATVAGYRASLYVVLGLLALAGPVAGSAIRPVAQSVATHPSNGGEVAGSHRAA